MTETFLRQVKGIPTTQSDSNLWLESWGPGNFSPERDPWRPLRRAPGYEGCFWRGWNPTHSKKAIISIDSPINQSGFLWHVNRVLNLTLPPKNSANSIIGWEFPGHFCPFKKNNGESLRSDFSVSVVFFSGLPWYRLLGATKGRSKSVRNPVFFFNGRVDDGWRWRI